MEEREIKQPISEQDLFDIGFRFLGKGEDKSGNGISGMQNVQKYRLDREHYCYVLYMYPYAIEQGRIEWIERNDVEIEDNVAFSAYREGNEMAYSHMSNIHAYNIDDLLTAIRLL